MVQLFTVLFCLYLDIFKIHNTKSYLSKGKIFNIRTFKDLGW